MFFRLGLRHFLLPHSFWCLVSHSHGCDHLLCRLFLPLLSDNVLEQAFQSSGPTPTANAFVRLRELCYLNQCQLNEQTLVAALTLVHVTVVH